MRIAQVAPLYEAVPPKLYGGTERVVAHLTDALVARGHEVVLFASADSETRAQLIPCRDVALRLDEQLSWDVPAHLAMLAEVKERADDFDILHFHLDCLHLPFFENIADKTITTVHGRQDIKDLRGLHRHYPNFPLVSISRSQRRPLSHLNWIKTIHHGYPESQYTFSPTAKGGYLAFLGRISPEKRPDRAIAIARAAGLPLKIAAKVDKVDEVYFREVIAPLLEGAEIEFVGEINDNAKTDFLGRAAGLLFPIDWPEPFGLVMIEAMACGTPVLAFRRGSVPEIVEDRLTGRIVSSTEEAVQAIPELLALDRNAVRTRFEQRFSSRRMASDYVKIYRSVLPRHASSEIQLSPVAALPAAKAGARAHSSKTGMRNEPF